MRREDLASVLEIERLSFAQPWSAEFFLQELRLPFSRVLLARAPGRDRRLVGYVCRWITAGELHILNVAVHPEWRRRSIGRRLVEHVIAEARQAKAERATLEVRQHNLPALALYERLGFREVGLRRNYYGAGEDALIMEHRLGPPAPPGDGTE
ncbi:MAG: ribosomal protein S18-alanine N-acetyltransferase [Candidatus Binatia bacterium]